MMNCSEFEARLQDSLDARLDPTTDPQLKLRL